MTDALFRLELQVDDYLESLGRAQQANSAWDVNLKEIAQRGTQYLQRYFDFLRKGSAESTRALTTLEGRLDSLTEKVASAANEGGAVKGFIGALDSLATSATGSSLAIDTLGSALGAILTPLGNIITMADAAARAIRRIPGVSELAGASGRGPGIGSRAAASERARIGALGDFPLVSDRNEAGANVVLPEEEIFGVTGGRGGGAGGGDQFRQGDTRALGDRFAAREALERERYNAARDLDGEWIAQQKDFAAQSNEIRHQWMLRQVAIDAERGAALRDQEDLNIQIERKAHMERLGLASQYAALLGNAGQQIAGVAGANAAALHLIEATSEGVQLAIAVAKAANPLGGQAFYPEVAAHALALATALAAAANPSKPNSGRGGGGGSSGGGGGQGVTGFAPSAGSGGAGGAPQTIVINIPGVYTTQRSLEAALVGALGSAADNGYPIPERALPERRR